MKKTIFLIPGNVFDKLTLISEEILEKREGIRRRYWNCKCLCGNTIRRREDSIFYRKHQSCGCDTSSIQATNTRRIKWKGVGRLGSTAFTACRRSARIRNIPFEITIEDAWRKFERQNGICSLSGVPIALSFKGQQTASLDRIDSNRGYSKDNIQWVHKIVNLMKNILNELEFISWCEKITRYRQSEIEYVI